MMKTRKQFLNTRNISLQLQLTIFTNIIGFTTNAIIICDINNIHPEANGDIPSLKRTNVKTNAIKKKDDEKIEFSLIRPFAYKPV